MNSLIDYGVLGIFAYVFLSIILKAFENNNKHYELLMDKVVENKSSMDEVSFKLFLEDRFKASIYCIKSDLVELIYENNLVQVERVNRKIANIINKRINESQSIVKLVNYRLDRKNLIFQYTESLKVSAIKDTIGLFDKAVNQSQESGKQIDYDSLKAEVKELANYYYQESLKVIDKVILED